MNHNFTAKTELRIYQKTDYYSETMRDITWAMYTSDVLFQPELGFGPEGTLAAQNGRLLVVIHVKLNKVKLRFKILGSIGFISSHFNQFSVFNRAAKFQV